MPEDPRLKVIRIKTGVVKRLAKEKLSYQKEAATLEEKLEAFKNSDSGSDDAAVAKFVSFKLKLVTPNLFKTFIS